MSRVRCLFFFPAGGKGAKGQLLNNLGQPSDVGGKGELPGTASRVQGQKEAPT